MTSPYHCAGRATIKMRIIINFCAAAQKARGRPLSVRQRQGSGVSVVQRQGSGVSVVQRPGVEQVAVEVDIIDVGELQQAAFDVFQMLPHGKLGRPGVFFD